MSDFPLVSVVIPVYNAQKTIAHTIQALLSQTYSGELEIIIVDDGSTDQTARIVESFSEVVCIHQSNAGPASARNRGAADSRGEYILFTDSDCIPRRNWVEQLVAGFKDMTVGAVCGSYGIANPGQWLAQCIHDEILYRHQERMPSYPKAFGSYNVGIRREVFFNAGGFDETYRRASGEDNDLSYKIIKKGWKIFFMKTAIVDHYHTTGVWKYLKEQFRHGFWRAKMYFDHPQMLKGDDYTFWKDIIEVPAVFVFVVGAVLVLTKLLPVKIFLLIIFVPFVALEFFLQKNFVVIFLQKYFLLLLCFFARIQGFLVCRRGFQYFS